jgi:hypothetical protein
MSAKDQAAASSEVAIKEQHALAMAHQFAEDADAGFEEADVNSYAIPYLQILQSGSPQCKKSDGAYIKGAEEGMLFNTVTQTLYPGETGIIVIPVHYTQRMVEWKVRESGGGFVAEHMPSEDVGQTHKDDKGRDILPNGNALVDTRNHYALLVHEDGSTSPALINMSSTQLKKSRQWMSLMQGIKIKNGEGEYVTAPMMSRMYRITTVPEQNDKGSWFGFKISLIGVVEDAGAYKAARAFRDAIKSGSAKAAPPMTDTVEETAQEF